MLTIITISSSVQAGLPHVSYVKVTIGQNIYTLKLPILLDMGGGVNTCTASKCTHQVTVADQVSIIADEVEF